MAWVFYQQEQFEVPEADPQKNRDKSKETGSLFFKDGIYEKIGNREGGAHRRLSVRDPVHRADGRYAGILVVRPVWDAPLADAD